MLRCALLLAAAGLSSAVYISTLDVSSVHELDRAEYAALQDLYTWTQGASWVNSSRWMTTADPCSWCVSFFGCLVHKWCHAAGCSRGGKTVCPLFRCACCFKLGACASCHLNTYLVFSLVGMSIGEPCMCFSLF